MLKAVFLDYTGTMVPDDEPNTRALLKYFITHSDLKDPNEILTIVWGKIKELEYELKGDDYISNDKRLDIILDHCVRNCGLRGDLKLMHEKWQKIWTDAPLYDDVRPFFEKCPLPIYIISNDDLKYLELSMKSKQLEPAGIISAEISKACKPHREIFELALETAKAKPDEVIHIGDSVVSDVNAAREVGITPMLLDRSGKQSYSDCRVITTLKELKFSEM